VGSPREGGDPQGFLAAVAGAASPEGCAEARLVPAGARSVLSVPGAAAAASAERGSGAVKSGAGWSGGIACKTGRLPWEQLAQQNRRLRSLAVIAKVALGVCKA